MEEAELTREIILRIANHADIMTRTIIFLLASSGMKISDALGILAEDIRFGKYHKLENGDVIRIPVEIYIPHDRMKAEKSHVYYISEESENLIKEYLMARKRQNDVLFKTKHKTNSLEGKRIFPINYSTATKRFILAEKAAGVYEWSEEGKRSKITFHSIRK